MANPQRENGHIDIANEIAEQLTRINLRPYEWRTLWAVFRKTYGWHKKEDDISLTQFQNLTGLEKRHQRKALKTLAEKNIIIRRKDGYIVTYGFQKDYTQWKVVPKQAPVSNISNGAYSSTTPVLKQAPEVVPKQAPTKENKETIQKKITEFFAYYLLKTQKDFRLTEDKRKLIEKRFEEGYTLEQLKLAVDNFIRDPWPERQKHLDLIYCIGRQRGKPDALEKWLNFTYIASPQKAAAPASLSLDLDKLLSDRLGRIATKDMIKAVLRDLSQELWWKVDRFLQKQYPGGGNSFAEVEREVIAEARQNRENFAKLAQGIGNGNNLRKPNKT